jgi:5'-methylthioadenosine phosphorylase
MTKAVLGIIGGSGLYDLPGLANGREMQVSSPWGDPSDSLRIGQIAETTVVFLARHGRGHRHSPSDINYRANIDALKRAGVTDLIAVSACGSFKEDLPPGRLVIVDQFIDRTSRRVASFFGSGCVAHVPFAEPTSPGLRTRVAAAAALEGIRYQMGGTCVCMEGPQFSTLAESLNNRAAGYDIVNMTSMPEAKLAREAEISYCLMAMVTDFDCWHPGHATVDVPALLRVMADNAGQINRIITRLAQDFPPVHESCAIGSDRALEHAIVTAPEARDPGRVAMLDAVAGRVLAAPCA